MSIFPKKTRSRALSTQPALAGVALKAATERKRARNAASKPRLWARRSAVVAALSFGLMTLFGSAAQANMIWDDTANAMSNVMNICRPVDSPPASVNAPLLGSAKAPNSETILPQFNSPDVGGDGLKRMEQALREARVESGGTSQPLNLVAGVKDQGFNRYGYGSLQWDNYGSPCFTAGSVLNGPVNAMLSIAVNGPAQLLSALMNFALSNVFYDLFYGMVGGFMALFATVLSPWVLMIVLTGGIITIMIRSKGSLSRILQLGCWMLAILGIFFGMQTQGLGREIASLANNSVTQMSNLIACQLVTADTTTKNIQNTGGGGSCGTIDTIKIDPKNPGATSGSLKITGGLDQAIWYAIPYQVWSMGAVGSEQYKTDHANEMNNQLSWSAALLNAKHVGDDNLGREVKNHVTMWNQAGYGTAGDVQGLKIRLWTAPSDRGWDPTNESGADSARVWNAVPYMGVVKALCNDTATGGQKDDNTKTDKTRYLPEFCDAAGANVGFINAFRGEYFWERGAAITSGALSILAVFIPLGAVFIYLMAQKTVFYFILLFAPIFLAIGAFPDEKRMGFAKKYFEFFIANLVKQIVAVCVVLFVMTGVSGVLTSDVVAWWMKPLGVVMFTNGLVFFAIPLATILKAAARGDSSIVEKTLTAPQRLAKTTAKVAGVAAIAAATMGVGAAAAGGLSAAGAAASGSGAVGAAAGAAGRVAAKKGAGTLLKSGVGLVKNGATTMINEVKAGGLKGAGENLTRMVKNGEAMRLLRYTGLGSTGAGKLLREGVGLSQLGLSFMNSKKVEDPAITQGKANARELGMQALDKDDYVSGTKKYERDAGGRLTDFGRQTVKDDYDKFYAGDPDGEMAEGTSNAALAQFHRNYHKMTGEYLATDPKNPANGGKAPTQQETAETIVQAMPTSSWQTAVVPNVLKPGAAIFNEAGGADAVFSKVNNGETLSKIYEAYGSMANMDPTHAAAASMINLGFAMSGKDEAYKNDAYTEAMAMIQEHGIPDKVAGFSASRDFSENFNPATVLSQAPNLTSSSTPMERAAAAGLFTQAAMVVPAGSVIAPSVDALREALLDTNTSVEVINELKSALANSVAMTDVRNPFFSEAPQPVPAASVPAPAAAEPIRAEAAPIPVGLPGTMFSAPEAPTQQAPVQQAAPAPQPAQAGPMFSSAPEREFVQQQEREEPRPSEAFFMAPQASPRHAAPAASGITSSELAEQLRQQRKDVVAEINETFNTATEKVEQDNDAADLAFRDGKTRRRSTGLFSKGDDE